MLCMQAGCEAGVATAAIASPDMGHRLVATAICCHSSSNATSQNRLERFVRRMRKLGDINIILYLAMAYILTEIKCPAWHKSTEQGSTGC